MKTPLVDIEIPSIYVKGGVRSLLLARMAVFQEEFEQEAVADEAPTPGHVIK